MTSMGFPTKKFTRKSKTKSGKSSSQAKIKSTNMSKSTNCTTSTRKTKGDVKSWKGETIKSIFPTTRKKETASHKATSLVKLTSPCRKGKSGKLTNSNSPNKNLANSLNK